MRKKPIKVGMVDDQHLFVAGIEQLLAQFDDIDFIGKAFSGRELLSSKLIGKMDILLMDIEMPEMDGFELKEQLNKSNPSLKVIVLTMHNEQAMVERMLSLGAYGFVTKDAEPEEFIDSIRVVSNNNRYFNNHFSISLIKKLPVQVPFNQPDFTLILSDRERDIIKMICHEYNSSEIAEKLSLSKRTVENHRFRIQNKLGARNTAGLVYKAITNNLVD